MKCDLKNGQLARKQLKKYLKCSKKRKKEISKYESLFMLEQDKNQNVTCDDCSNFASSTKPKLEFGI